MVNQQLYEKVCYQIKSHIWNQTPSAFRYTMLIDHGPGSDFDIKISLITRTLSFARPEGEIFPAFEGRREIPDCRYDSLHDHWILAERRFTGT